MRQSPTIRVALSLLLLPAIVALSAFGEGPNCIRFAVIGDYGDDSDEEADVAALVAGWNPDFIVTTGDNNYPLGEAETIDANIGQYYHDFIYPYRGAYGDGADTNRFFPSLGNHDWGTGTVQPYLDYFRLPHNERYYDFVWGPVHFFVVDSDPNEPDGRSSSSPQAQWIKAQLLTSTAPWQIVTMHHPPYSSGQHGSTEIMQWPYKALGVDAVMAGHDHLYERLQVDGLTYFVNGAGGRNLYDFGTPLPGSQVRYNDDFGAMQVDACEDQIVFKFVNRQDDVIDSFVLTPGAAIMDNALHLPVIQQE